jgi:hypothetical protein
VLNAPHVLVPPYAAATNSVRRGRDTSRPAARQLRILAIDVHGALTVARPADRTLTLAFEEPFPHDAFSRVYRSADRPFAVGEAVEMPPVTSKVEAVAPDGRATRVAFHFDVPLDDPSLVWVVWEGRGFVPYRPPAVGASETRAAIDVTGASSDSQ